LRDVVARDHKKRQDSGGHCPEQKPPASKAEDKTEWGEDNAREKKRGQGADLAPVSWETDPQKGPDQPGKKREHAEE